MEIKGKIKVNSVTKFVLLNYELLGQFSDGYWENSRNQSERFLSEVEITDGEECTEFEAPYIPSSYKGYNVNNTELLSYIGDRMLIKSRLAKVLNIYNFHGIEYFVERFNEGTTVEDVEKELNILKESSGDYFKNKAKLAEVFLNKVGIENFVEAINNTNAYTMKDMRKDLREITKALKNTKLLK